MEPGLSGCSLGIKSCFKSFMVVQASTWSVTRVVIATKPDRTKIEMGSKQVNWYPEGINMGDQRLLYYKNSLFISGHLLIFQLTM
eukprot:2239972-Amphidinium_carterae.2